MTTREQLDDRYGRTRRGVVRGWWIAVAIVAVCIVGLAGWMVFASSAAEVDADDLGYEVTSDGTVDVSFRITSTSGSDVVCILEALDESFGVVGWQVVEIPATESIGADYTRTVRTVDTATTGYVNSCSLR
ncbi:DUF4307 domain-containing protein [Microbacterium karelineae]|uniref:DUF4307 domain-containing protein n=1 Tax=Microbacterium karelineae TaxID=2654283 RepID=UPI0012EA720D|nr:DUF4307 domain-containing protein [Microbacterium karelineae]